MVPAPVLTPVSPSTASSKSSHTSKYFGSVDSSETDLAKQPPGAGAGANEHLMKYVLQDPIWLLMANTDDKVMMTYQLPGRWVPVDVGHMEGTRAWGHVCPG